MMHSLVNARLHSSLPTIYSCPHNGDMNLADRLDQAVQIRFGGNQSEFSRASGISQPTINRILKGKTPTPDFKTLKKLADALSVSTDWLTDGIGHGPEIAQERSGIDKLVAELHGLESMGPQWADLAQAITMLVRKLKEAQKAARHEHLTPEMRGVVETLCELDKLGGEEREYAISQVSALLRGPRERVVNKKKHAS